MPDIIQRIQKLMSSFFDFYCLEITEDEVFIKREISSRCGHETDTAYVRSLDEAEDFLLSQLLSK